MIIVDAALRQQQEEGRPIRVAFLGAGYMVRGVAFQIITAVPEMGLVAVSNRTLETARKAYRNAGVDLVRVVETATDLERAMGEGICAITDNAMVV